MPVRYEWDIETVAADEHEDILDHDHRAKLSEFGMEELIHAINQDREPGNEFTRLVLVRDRYDEGGVICRSWAYLTDDKKMPEQFLDANQRPVAKIPKRYIEEFNL
jgi:hypothetical protein